MKFLRIFTFAIVALVAAPVGVALAIPIDGFDPVDDQIVTCMTSADLPVAPTVAGIHHFSKNNIDGNPSRPRAPIIDEENSEAIANGDRLLWRSEATSSQFVSETAAGAPSHFG